MDSEPQINDLISLVRDTREQLVYLRELGIENTDRARCSETPVKTIPGTQTGLPHLHRSLNPSMSIDARSGNAAIVATTVTANEQGPGVAHTARGTLFDDTERTPVTISRSSETLEQIWSDIGACTRCSLYPARTNIVHTEGNRRARLMFVGEAPGADEDSQARPFVGRAGKLLTKIIEAIGFKREDVLIGNVNRCRPPANRPPTQEEASICKPFLLREIESVQPEVIVVLGNTAMRNLLDIKQGITKVRGQFQDYRGVKVMPTFHPAYLLRDPSKKQETWDDLKKVRDYLATTPRRTS